jgi:BirA family biotin operon repressor/biotin-[acetyl-CoA-carboxylase] ligase
MRGGNGLKKPTFAHIRSLGGKRYMPETIFTGKHSIRLEETPSTNTYAQGMLREKPPEGTLVLAYKQSAGRGQKGNVWLTEPGLNLTFSLIYYPGFLSVKQIFLLSKITSIALRDTLLEFVPMQEVDIKWPNDVLLNAKKVAGILIENQLEGNRISSSVIGVGLNVNQAKFPIELKEKATSLFLVKKEKFDTEEVLGMFLSKLEARYLELKNKGSSNIDQQYIRYLYGYQEEILFEREKQSFRGMIVGVDESGRLAVAEENQLRYYDFKEIRFLY